MKIIIGRDCNFFAFAPLDSMAEMSSVYQIVA